MTDSKHTPEAVPTPEDEWENRAVHWESVYDQDFNVRQAEALIGATIEGSCDNEFVKSAMGKEDDENISFGPCTVRGFQYDLIHSGDRNVQCFILVDDDGFGHYIFKGTNITRVDADKDN